MAAVVCGWRELAGGSRVGVRADLKGDLDDMLDACLSSPAGLEGDEVGDNIPLLPLSRLVAPARFELSCRAAFSLQQAMHNVLEMPELP